MFHYSIFSTFLGSAAPFSTLIIKVIDHIKTPLTYLYLGGNHIARQHIEDLQNTLYTIHIMTQENGMSKGRDGLLQNQQHSEQAAGEAAEGEEGEEGGEKSGARADEGAAEAAAKS